MKNKLLIILIVFFLTSPPKLYSQSDNPESDKYTLLTMPYNKRPLTLYKGQFQADGGYKFALIGRTYDSNGDLIVLKDQGTASVLHFYHMEVKYGITDFLEVSAETNYMKKGIRSESLTYISGIDQMITVNNLDESRGMSDLFLLGSIRLPMTYEFFDFRVTGGISFPTAKHEPLQPTHTVTNVILASIYTINYHYNNKNGSGVPVYLLSGAAKFTVSKFSFETNLILRDPVKEGENIRWSEMLQPNRTFTYFSNSYRYLLNRTITLDASLHYQAAGWLNIKLNANYYNSRGGWTEYYGNKYSNPEQKMVTLEPGLEIQISPALKIWQVAGLPLSGMNMDGPFYLYITLSFNMFPFMR
jgi:hypothetical protein